MSPPANHTPRRAATQADKDLLFKGVTCALIGAVVLLAPYVARSDAVRDIMAQAAAVGWFALALGAAFLAQFAVRRRRAARRRSDTP